MKHHLDGFFQNGGTTAYILRAMDGWETAAAAVATDGGSPASNILEASSPGLWGNSVSIGLLPSSDADATRFRIAVVYPSPETGEASLPVAW